MGKWSLYRDPFGWLSIEHTDGRFMVGSMSTEEELESLLKDTCCAHNKDIDTLTSRAEAAELERDLYRQYYDAIIDMAVVNWTLDGLSQRDAHHAIQRIVLQHAQDMCDPQLNEELAKLKARAEAAEDKVRALLELLEPDYKRPYEQHWYVEQNADEVWRRAVAIAEGET